MEGGNEGSLDEARNEGAGFFRLLFSNGPTFWTVFVGNLLGLFSGLA